MWFILQNKASGACTLCYLCAKNFHNWSNFDKVLTKNKFAQFFETRCSGWNVGLVIERSRVPTHGRCIPGYARSTQPSIPPGSVNRIPA